MANLIVSIITGFLTVWRFVKIPIFTFLKAAIPLLIFTKIIGAILTAINNIIDTVGSSILSTFDWLKKIWSAIFSEGCFPIPCMGNFGDFKGLGGEGRYCYTEEHATNLGDSFVENETRFTCTDKDGIKRGDCIPFEEGGYEGKCSCHCGWSGHNCATENTNDGGDHMCYLLADDGKTYKEGTCQSTSYTSLHIFDGSEGVDDASGQNCMYNEDA